MEAVLKAKGLARSFDGVPVLKGVSLELYPGHVTGFVGANGAGKTTTMRILTLLDIQERGELEIFGCNSFQHYNNLKYRLGWMPDLYGTYELMTVYEYFDFMARAYKILGKKRKQRVEEILTFMDMENLRNNFIDTLSKGQKQRLCFGRTLLNDPEILILDEPAAGLDPKARMDFKHLVRLLAKSGKAVFISSHILSELEDMCDSILFINEGKIIHSGLSEELKENENKKTLIDIKAAVLPEVLENALILQPNLKILESVKDGFCVEIANYTQEESIQILKSLISAGISVYDFHIRQKKLEEVFIEVVDKLNAKGKK